MAKKIVKTPRGEEVEVEETAVVSELEFNPVEPQEPYPTGNPQDPLVVRGRIYPQSRTPGTRIE